LGLSIGFSMVWTGVAVSGEASVIQVAANSINSPSAPAASQQGGTLGGMSAAEPTRTAQLEWLFGPRQQPQPQRANRQYEGRRYIYIQRREQEYGSRRLRRSDRNSDRYSGSERTYGRLSEREKMSERAIERANKLAADQAAARGEAPPPRPLTRAEKEALERLKVRVAEKLRTAPPAPSTVGPLLITVSLARQTITLYDQGVEVAQSPISSGMSEFPTPTGVFSVLQKRWFHSSNIYSGAPMPYMQRLTWSGIALHGGVVPGYRASHGCIRLPEQFAIRLWGTTRPGVRVVIAENDLKPVEITHQVLFRSKASPEQLVAPPAPGAQPQASLPPNMAALFDPAAIDADFVGLAPVSLMEEMERTLPAVAEITILRGGDTAQVARISKVAAHASAGGAGITKVRVASQDGVTKSEIAAAAQTRTASITVVRGGGTAEVHEIEMPAPVITTSSRPGFKQITAVVDTDRDEDLDVPQAKLEQPVSVPEAKVNSAVTIGYSGGDSMKVAAKVATPQERRNETVPLPQARPLVPMGTSVITPFVAPPPAVTTPAATTPAAPMPAATAPGAAPAAAAQPVVTPKPEPQAKIELPRMLRPGPLSVYISQKAQRIYVRKGFEPLFEMPVTFASNGDIGTYVFTANAFPGDSSALRWTVVELDNLATGVKASGDPQLTLANARTVLDRIQLPPDTAKQVSELVRVGSTIIVSDLAPKMGPDNDFSVTTSPPPVEKPVAALPPPQQPQRMKTLNKRQNNFQSSFR
jgi:hypothetical protein